MKIHRSFKYDFLRLKSNCMTAIALACGHIFFIFVARGLNKALVLLFHEIFKLLALILEKKLPT